MIIQIRGAVVHRGGKIGPTRWASPVHPELGLGWAIKLLTRKNRAKFGPTQYGPIQYCPARPGPPEFFLPSKGYLHRPARFLERAGLLKLWHEKSDPILARPDFGPAHCWHRSARLIASSSRTLKTLE